MESNSVLKTYDEWVEIGYGVLKGEKSKIKKNGKFYFDETQVINIEKLYKEQFRRSNNKMINSFIGK